jgi:hypothetical protein
MTNIERGPFCQSCAMPLKSPEDFGTDAAGFRVNDYCVHCFGDGRFTEPSITMQQMIDKCVPFMAQNGMPEAEARALMNRVLPTFKRWASAGDSARSSG